MWTDWLEPYRNPDSPEVAQFQKKHWRSVLFYQYVQWQVDRQLEGAQILRAAKTSRLVSITTSRSRPTVTAPTCGRIALPSLPAAASAPRPTISPQRARTGHSRRLTSDYHFETGYRLFADSIRNNIRHGGALRLDHVMRFFRLYWIPDGADATGGAYVRDRHEDYIRILALESVRRKVIVVGEDLGTVEPEVRETLARFGILSYRLFYFERNQQGGFRPFREYPESALVSTTTHDLPTLAGFWINEDIEARHRLGLLQDEAGYRAQLDARARDKQAMLDLLRRLDLLPRGFPASAADVPELTGDLHNAVIGFPASTPSKLLLVNQEDLTKEVQQQNLPGTTWQYPNWSRKLCLRWSSFPPKNRARLHCHVPALADPHRPHVCTIHNFTSSLRPPAAQCGRDDESRGDRGK